MMLDHHTVRSAIFEHIRTFEVDLEFGENLFPTRIELFRDMGTPGRYRARFWQLENYRIHSTFPQDPTTGDPLDEPSDEELLVERSHFGTTELRAFSASSDQAAIEHASAILQQSLDHAFGSGTT